MEHAVNKLLKKKSYKTPTTNNIPDSYKTEYSKISVKNIVGQTLQYMELVRFRCIKVTKFLL